VTCVSIVHLLAPGRIGLSCQFMNKSLRNLRETGRAQVMVLEPHTLAEYVLDVEFVQLVDSGAVSTRWMRPSTRSRRNPAWPGHSR
jgi:hypothetical protein